MLLFLRRFHAIGKRVIWRFCMNLFNAAARRPSENQSAGQKRSPHGEGDKTERIHKNKIIVECGSAKGGSPDIGKGGCTLPTERGRLSMKCNFFAILICQKKLLKTYFFWQTVCLKAVTRQAVGLGLSENGIFGRKVMGVKKFNFIQCVGFVLRFVW